jgi:hypothetical protein
MSVSVRFAPGDTEFRRAVMGGANIDRHKLDWLAPFPAFGHMLSSKVLLCSGLQPINERKARASFPTLTASDSITEIWG